MNYRLAGKVVVVTGATRGLGLAITQACSAAGAAVVVTSRTAPAIEHVITEIRRQGGQAAGIPCDVAEPDQVQAVAALALSTFGHLDVWVNNAGISAPFGPTLDVPPVDFRRVIHTNILGTYNGSFVAMQHFVAQGRGKLINIFGAGDRKVRPLQNAYGSSKSWVRVFTETLAKEYADAGIEVIGYNPGLVETDLVGDVEVVPGYAEKVKPLETVVRIWGNPPGVPAARLVRLASSATDGKNGMIVRELTIAAQVKGVMREGLRRLLKRPPGEFTLAVRTIDASRQGM